MLELTRSGLGAFECLPLPTRPMVTRTLFLDNVDSLDIHARVAALIESTPADAVVRLQVTGAIPAMLSAAALRTIAGTRTVTLAARHG